MEEIPENALGHVSPRAAKIYERIIASNRAANLLIILFVFLAAIPLLGIGLFATEPYAPPSSASDIANG